MEDIKIKTYLISSKSNDNGEAPIYLRIILNGQYIQLSTKIFVRSEFWDIKKKEIKSKHPESLKLNLSIADKKKRLFDIHSDLARTGKSSLLRIKDIWTGKEDQTHTILTLIEYSNNAIKSKLGSTYAKATYQQYCALKKKVACFIKSVYRIDDINLESLDLAFITKFESFLVSHYKNAVNTVAKNMDRLKSVIHFGQRHDWLKDDPFKNYKKVTLASNREYLTLEEMDRLRELDLRDQEHLTRVRDIFIFICHTGISYTDLASLTSSNIITDIRGDKLLYLERTKTLGVCSIPLLPKADEILQKYKDHPISQNKGTLLPVICNQKMNDYLKIIATRAKISKPVTCHIGRHTFAVMSLEMGVPIETVSRVLGHKSIKTTQIYAKVTNSKIMKDYGKFYESAEVKSKAI